MHDLGQCTNKILFDNLEKFLYRPNCAKLFKYKIIKHLKSCIMNLHLFMPS